MARRCGNLQCWSAPIVTDDQLCTGCLLPTICAEDLFEAADAPLPDTTMTYNDEPPRDPMNSLLETLPCEPPSESVSTSFKIPSALPVSTVPIADRSLTTSLTLYLPRQNHWAIYLHHSLQPMVTRLGQSWLQPPTNQDKVFLTNRGFRLLYHFFITTLRREIWERTRAKEAAPHATIKER